jgi:hypothetical protein
VIHYCFVVKHKIKTYPSRKIPLLGYTAYRLTCQPTFNIFLPVADQPSFQAEKLWPATFESPTPKGVDGNAEVSSQLFLIYKCSILFHQNTWNNLATASGTT